MTVNSKTTAPRKPLMSNGESIARDAHVTRILVAVATACIVGSILGAAAHITATDIHQSRDMKRAQDDKWWLENWRTYAQPQINEIKELLKERIK